MIEAKLHAFVEQVAAEQFEHCFNPYADRCPVHDSEDAPTERANTLSRLIQRAEACEVDAIWIGRDLGYRGGRRTGLALTDDVHIAPHLARWGLMAKRPTVGAAVAERTAAVIWQMLSQTQSNVFLWNVFPLHPHEPGNPFSNRQHNALERRFGEEALAALIGLLRPKRIVCIGNNAYDALGRFQGAIPTVAVRHPSYGGQKQFVAQISALYGIEARGQRTLL
ncbi:uracil-DNA glycosylase [Pollutimonas thiosulfatoxidans]|uniref:Uracil-DNA glycosylase n=1 Tax=Pollutimonas thiosulfatoxidans TaxID=2028345 RepID=A0A410GBC6_9BURK|nr:uracil-DNA glycosylase [Pollutimonas thiosulfatoxidans]QAA93596.1 uracil-DNA glycosylase [Pollutimonas thiosulfatoxidans]